MEWLLSIACIALGLLFFRWLAGGIGPESPSSQSPSPQGRRSGLNPQADTEDEEPSWRAIGGLTGMMGPSIEHGFLAQYVLRRARQVQRERDSQPGEEDSELGPSTDSAAKRVRSSEGP